MTRRVKLWTSACGVVCTGEVAVLFTTWMWCSYLLISAQRRRRAPLSQNPCNSVYAVCVSMFKWTGHKLRRESGRIACVWVLFMWRVIFIYFWCNTFLWYICCCFFLLFSVFFKCQGSDSFKRTDLNKRCDVRLLFNNAKLLKIFLFSTFKTKKDLSLSLLFSFSLPKYFLQ